MLNLQRELQHSTITSGIVSVDHHLHNQNEPNSASSSSPSNVQHGATTTTSSSLNHADTSTRNVPSNAKLIHFSDQSLELTGATTTATLNQNEGGEQRRRQKAKVLNNYVAQGPDELSLATGESIWVENCLSNDDDCDWMMGWRNVDGVEGDKGKVPIAYLELLD